MSRFFSPHRTHEPIVIVGDDVAFLELLREGISDAGYRTVCARDGSEALAAITNQKPAMIFVDIQMPGMDGASLLAKIERSPVLSRIPRAVLQKPVRFEQVLRTIQRLVPADRHVFERSR